MATKRVSRRIGLPNVPYTDWPAEKQKLCDVIKAHIEDEAEKLLPGVNIMFQEPNTFKLGEQYGFSFGVSKFSEGFTEYVRQGVFRYKDKELFKVVSNTIRALPELDTTYRWDAGFGVFVVNLFLK